jgi:hypothetical protein
VLWGGGGGGGGVGYIWEENIFPYYFSMHGDFFKSTSLSTYHLDGREAGFNFMFQFD